MATNIRLLYDILFYAEKNNIPGLLLLIDFASAFDTVSWSFMIKTLDFFNFGDSVKRWVSLFYTNVESCVIVNGHMSEFFFLQRGCRQGDSLSPYLFILCAEILSILLRNNPKIKGIRIQGTEYIVSQYADDTSLTLDGSQESLLNTMKVLKFYGNISGLNVNTDKTKVIWFGSMKNSQTIICPEYNLVWENAIFTVLGIKFTTDLPNMIKINYDSKIEEIEKLLASWSRRILTPIGKLVVIKTLALAKINHLILGIPNPPKSTINAIQNMFYKFLWNKSPDKVKRSIITQEYKYGGLKMIDLETFMVSLKSTWIRRLLSMKNKFSHLVESSCPAFKHFLKYGSSYITKQLHIISNPFWKEVLISYKEICQKIKVDQDNQCHSIPLWYNPDIKVGGKPVYYKKWLAAGVVMLGDLFNAEGQFYSYRDFIHIFNVNTNFLEYQGLLAAVKKYLQLKDLQHIPIKSFNPTQPLGLTVINADKKGCRAIYKLLLKTEEIPTSLPKWSNDLINIPNSNVWDIRSIYEIVFKTTKDSKLQWFQYRINHRILGTNYLLKKMNITQDESCSFCNNSPETILHLFWMCDISKNFWSQVRTYINSKCGLNMNEFTVFDILFGNTKLDRVINIILLQAKLFLYQSKLNHQLPLKTNLQ